VAAVVIVTLVVLFLYGMATNPAYRWNIFAEYLFNDRILFGGTPAADHLLDGARHSAGWWSRRHAAVTQPDLPVGVGCSSDISRHADLRAVGVLGLIPTIYANIQPVPFGPSFFHQPAGAVHPVYPRDVGLALNEAAYIRKSSAPESVPVPEGRRGLHGAWHVDTTMQRTVLPQAMRVIIPPTGNEVARRRQHRW
jgi:polar amino acid transport system permease protein